MKGFGTLTAILFIIAIVALGPVLVIWALNTLFAFGIELTIWTWLATAILCSVVSGNVKAGK
jgi:uncharacterized membrane protein